MNREERRALERASKGKGKPNTRMTYTEKGGLAQLWSVKKEIHDAIKVLARGAGIATLFGDSASKIAAEAGVLLYTIAWACKPCGIDMSRPEIRIMRGMNRALGELANDIGTVESHRASIASGLEAMDRVLKDIDPIVIGTGFLDCKEKVSRYGVGTADIDALLTVKSEVEKTLGKPAEATTKGTA